MLGNKVLLCLSIQVIDYGVDRCLDGEVGNHGGVELGVVVVGEKVEGR